MPENIKRVSFDPNNYVYYVKKYIEISKSKNKAITYNELRLNNLPDAKWYVKHCHNKNIKTWGEFLGLIGFPSIKNHPSKKVLINYIREADAISDRPLMYDDFRGKTGFHKVTINLINHVWGSLNNMKKEAGLEIVQESMIDKVVTKEIFDDAILKIKEYACTNGNMVAIRKINDIIDSPSKSSLVKYSKHFYGMELSEYLNTLGISVMNNGLGLTYEYPDGEFVSSQFEHIFSDFLRSHGFKYGIDYRKDVMYSEFIPNINNNYECDYVLNVNGEKIYIEIAGIIESYKRWYYNNLEIYSSKNKEKYRKKLFKKESILKNNGLKYFILFPCDLFEQTLNEVINNPSLELKKQIESYMKNNIKWSDVRNKLNI